MIIYTNKECLTNENKDLYLGWKDMKFKIYGKVEVYTVPKEELCQDVNDATNVFLTTVYTTMEECAQTCPKYQKSRIPLLNTKADYEHLKPKWQSYSQGLGNCWWFPVVYDEEKVAL